jgi:hypothetical protein
VLQISEDGVLIDDMIDLFEPDYFGFFQGLESDVFVGGLIPRQFDPTERP